MPGRPGPLWPDYRAAQSRRAPVQPHVTYGRHFQFEPSDRGRQVNMGAGVARRVNHVSAGQIGPPADFATGGTGESEFQSGGRAFIERRKKTRR